MNTKLHFLPAWFVLGAITARADSGRYQPSRDDAVVAHLRPAEFPAVEREIRSLRRSLAENPEDLEAALHLARKLIGRTRDDADPRFLGQAEAALSPWWRRPEAPAEVLLLRATIEQSRHEFGASLATLDRLLKRDPRSGGAWLTKATLHLLRGEYDEARRACLALSRFSDPLVAITATAALGGVTGSGEPALTLLTNALAHATNAGVATRVWSHGVAADLAERLGRPELAEANFRAALGMAPKDPFLLAVYADFLLNRSRFREVLNLLAPYPEQDALLLRWAEASRAVSGQVPASVLERLQSGFAAGRRRGIAHAREEGRFYLGVAPDPAKALHFARENWEQQREPVDLRLRLAAAIVAGDAAERAAALVWAGKNRLEDAQLDRLDSAP